MFRTRSARRWHRWLGLVVGVQLALWIVSGIYFAWTDLDEIHGDPWREPAPPLVLDEGWVSPSAIDVRAAGLRLPVRMRRIEAVEILGAPHYRLRVEAGDEGDRVVLADARTGAVRGPLDRDEAVATARASLAPDAEVVDVARIEAADVGPHHEYRGGPLPAWRVRFDHPRRIHVYVAAEEARVVTHRNRGWRLFDALWMLHTMDYGGRDDFNNPVIRGASVAALAVAVTGFVLGWRTRRRRRRRGSATGE